MWLTSATFFCPPLTWLLIVFSRCWPLSPPSNTISLWLSHFSAFLPGSGSSTKGCPRPSALLILLEKWLWLGLPCVYSWVTRLFFHPDPLCELQAVTVVAKVPCGWGPGSRFCRDPLAHSGPSSLQFSLGLSCVEPSHLRAPAAASFSNPLLVLTHRWPFVFQVQLQRAFADSPFK